MEILFLAHLENSLTLFILFIYLLFILILLYQQFYTYVHTQQKCIYIYAYAKRHIS